MPIAAIFDSSEFDDHEEIVFASDRETGLRAVIAIHSTILGPALGGCRMYPYPSEADAVRDVLRLSRGMSFKAAVAGVNLGGGKSVIIGDSQREKTPELLRAMGRAIKKLGGRYITGEDIGRTRSAASRKVRADMEIRPPSRLSVYFRRYEPDSLSIAVPTIFEALELRCREWGTWGFISVSFCLKPAPNSS